ncbi:hypothetical protein Vretifemale_16261 [Volvox reticuliferus]|uniref:DUS-like FMN-binding domain-containing protein n=1 Tax=Volvox reticuliferus TaxID=1737510 RepID=A0A8J4FSB2_9CHLO|nr:hypothetical protein Vretifemale_16261 [Volvox reticuliferus]
MFGSNSLRNRVLSSSNCDRQRRCTVALWALPKALQGIPGQPSLDYVSSLKGYRYEKNTCPLLFLAPMENLADRSFRRALAATVGGFDEACTGTWRGICGNMSGGSARAAKYGRV